MMILSLVAVAGLEKCCITSAYLQWLLQSGQQAVAHESLVSSDKLCMFHLNAFIFYFFEVERVEGYQVGFIYCQVLVVVIFVAWYHFL